jgi:hypothetical protein
MHWNYCWLIGMKIYFDKRLLFVLSIARIVLVVPGVFSITSLQRLINNADLVGKTSVYLETGQREYIINVKALNFIFT